MTPVDLTSKVKWPGHTRPRLRSLFPPQVIHQEVNMTISHTSYPVSPTLHSNSSRILSILQLTLQHHGFEPCGSTYMQSFFNKYTARFGYPPVSNSWLWVSGGYWKQSPVDTEHLGSPKSPVSFSTGSVGTANPLHCSSGRCTSKIASIPSPFSSPALPSLHPFSPG